MKWFASLLVALAAGGLMAFDSADWHGKRELFMREAERLAGVYTNVSARVSNPAENVTIPLDSHPDGSIKVSVSATKAQYFLKEGLVWAEGVVVRSFSPTGAPESRIDAQSCVIDREARAGWAAGDVKVTHGQTACRGRDVFFSAPESYVRIFRDARVDAAGLRIEGVRR